MDILTQFSRPAVFARLADQIRALKGRPGVVAARDRLARLDLVEAS